MAPGVVTASRAAEASLGEAVAAASGALEAAAACLGGGGGEGAAERASTLEEAIGRYAAASAELRRQVGVCARVSASDGADANAQAAGGAGAEALKSEAAELRRELAATREQVMTLAGHTRAMLDDIDTSALPDRA